MWVDASRVRRGTLARYLGTTLGDVGMNESLTKRFAARASGSKPETFGSVDAPSASGLVRLKSCLEPPPHRLLRLSRLGDVVSLTSAYRLGRVSRVTSRSSTLNRRTASSSIANRLIVARAIASRPIASAPMAPAPSPRAARAIGARADGACTLGALTRGPTRRGGASPHLDAIGGLLSLSQTFTPSCPVAPRTVYCAFSSAHRLSGSPGREAEQVP